MAFNGAGVFNRVHNWTQDAANGINIMADRMDAEDSGFAAGLSICLTRDGQSVMQAPLDMAGFKILRLGSPTLNTDAVNLSYFKDNPIWTVDGSNILTFDTQPIFGAGFKLASTTPQIIFEETDQVDPAGRHRFFADAKFLSLTHATVAGGFASEARIFRTRPDLTPGRFEMNYELYNVLPSLWNGGSVIIGDSSIQNAFRLKVGATAAGVGVIARTDSTYFYFMLTADGDANGSFGALRPFMINKTNGLIRSDNGQLFNGGITVNDGAIFATGIPIFNVSPQVRIDGTCGYYMMKADGTERGLLYATGDNIVLRNRVAGVTVGQLQFISDGRISWVGQHDGLTIYNSTAGIDFTTALATGPTILDKHIKLHPNNYGHCVTSGRLNHVVGSGLGAHDFYTALVLKGSIGTDIDGVTGLSMRSYGHMMTSTTGAYCFGALSERMQYNGSTAINFIMSTTAARVDVVGTASPSAQTIITREKGDLRYASASSRRFKDGITIAPQDKLIEAFDKLLPSMWKWGGEIAPTDERFGTVGVGLIAEDVDQVLPAAVRRQWLIEDEDDGTPEEPRERNAPTKTIVSGLDPLALIAVLVAKIKQLEERLDGVQPV